MEHEGGNIYFGLSDLPMEMWLEIIRHASWRIAWSLVLSCKYSYMALSKYFKHPKIKVQDRRDDRYRLPKAAILIKKGRIYLHSFRQRRDRTFTSLAEMLQFLADLKNIENSFGHLPAPNNDTGIYKSIIKERGYERVYYKEAAAERVFRFVLNFTNQIYYSIPQKDPGIVIISIGESTDRKKICPIYLRPRRIYRDSFEIRFVLDAEGNLEWRAPGGYEFRTIYAKQLYEDLKEAITSDKAHLKPLEMPKLEKIVYLNRSYLCVAFFKAKFIDKFGKKYKLHRVILHEYNERTEDNQNYKETTFETILKHMDRVLDKRDVRTKPWLTALCYAKGRQTLPWYQLFRPPADLEYDTLNFIHWK